MKLTHFKIAFLLIPVFLFFGSRAQAQEEPKTEGLEQEEILIKPESDSVDLNTFLDELSPEGDWVKIDDNSIDNEDNLEMSGTVDIDDDVYTGYVWRPRLNIYYASWNPYTNGRWVWTYYGWIWQSDYDWGWACYHYGRWWFSPYYGWVWSPGRRWAPNWVSWCHNGNYVGWHPIRPRSPWRWHNGVIVAVPVTPRQKSITTKWTFVNKTDFASVINSSNVVDLKTNKTLISDVKMDKRGKGPSATEIGSVSGQKINQKKVTFTNQEGKKYSVELNNGLKNNTQKNNSQINQNNNPKTNGNNTEVNKTKNTKNETVTNKNNGSRNNKGSRNNGNSRTGSKNNTPRIEKKQSPNRESNNNGYTPPKNETKQSPNRESYNSGNNTPRNETRQSPNRESNNSRNSGNNSSRNNDNSSSKNGNRK